MVTRLTLARPPCSEPPPAPDLSSLSPDGADPGTGSAAATTGTANRLASITGVSEAYGYAGTKKAQALFDISPAANRTSRSGARISQTSTSCRCEGYAG